MVRLNAIILTYNEQQHVADCIESLRFADQITVFDSFSTDATAELARAAGAEVIAHRFKNYAAQRNAALESASGRAEWVLFVDADERVTPELAEEVLASIDYPDFAGFRIPRHNYIFGHLTLGAGWYPDYQTRLLRVGKVRYDMTHEVHEIVILDGPEGTLRHPFIHHNYSDLRQFFQKQRRYAALDAQMAFKRSVRPALKQFVSMPLRHFWYRFVTLHGYRDGLHGLRMSLLMAWYEFYKLMLLQRLWSSGAPKAGTP
ncbi:MAG: glycosyltransferase family 2 protein [Chloroflexi bacterium]|nr:glycosyltransferase family 2 protein [Chloroflexota bacterium]